MAAKKARRKARKTTRRKARKTARSRRPVIVYNFANPKARKASKRTKRKAAKKRTTRRHRIKGTINGTMNTKNLMNAAKGGALVYLGRTVGRIAADKLPDDINPNLKAAGFILVGALAHKVQPDAMKGLIAEGIGMIADPMLKNAGVITGSINAIDDDLADEIEDAAMQGLDDTITGAETLSDY